MHTVDDAARIRELLGQNPSMATVTLLGAGFIGAETASYLADRGAAVHLVSRPMLPLRLAVGDAIARRVVDLHRDHVTTHFGREVTAVYAGADSVTVTLDDDTRIESDLVIVAHGTSPASGWAAGPAGSDGGIAVDDRLRGQRLRRVYAAGSLAVHVTSAGVRYRVDHWDAAAAQGAHAARTVLHDLAGAPDPGPYVPATGFSLTLYRQSISTYGVVLPSAQQCQLQASSQAGILTGFADSRTGALIAVAGLGTGPELPNLRGRLRRP